MPERPVSTDESQIKLSLVFKDSLNEKRVQTNRAPGMNNGSTNEHRNLCSSSFREKVSFVQEWATDNKQIFRTIRSGLSLKRADSKPDHDFICVAQKLYCLSREDDL